MSISGEKALFGTDGIRGKANHYPITCQMAMQAGYAIGEFIQRQNKTVLVIGRDTRISGAMLESALAAGAAAVGVNVLLAGVIPTPAVACLCSQMQEAGAGAVISASHNPYGDNGIKFFDGNGYKLDDSQEFSIESRILGHRGPVNTSEVGSILPMGDARQVYEDFLLQSFAFTKEKSFLGNPLRIVIDGANGAASSMLERVFFQDCFAPNFIHHQPDGYNINEHCGSQHLASLRKQVMEQKADIGLAFDGDADRLIAIDEKGNEITGDMILAICAWYGKEKGQLPNPVVVSTIMSNIGLSRSLESMGISHVKTRVGDRNVFQGMQESGAVLGGEDSGHIIFSDVHTTGDGMFCALKLLDILLDTQKKMSELGTIMTVYPQVLQNVPVHDAKRPNVRNIPGIAKVIEQVERELKEQGRVVIRYSGTQPLLRVMVEGPDEKQTRGFCQRICDAVTTCFSK